MRGDGNLILIVKPHVFSKAALNNWEQGLWEFTRISEVHVQLVQAIKVTHMRGSHTVSMEDIIFLLRKDKVYHKHIQSAS